MNLHWKSEATKILTSYAEAIRTRVPSLFKTEKEQHIGSFGEL